MPLASPPGRPDVVYGFGRIDASGRVADRVTIAALGWRGGDRLTLTAEAGVMIAPRDPGGMVTVPARPYVVIPAALRRRCGLRTGDHVLLAASPGQDTLAAYSALGMAGQVAYHLMAQAGMMRAPWAITTIVSCLPVLVLGMGTALAHMLRADAEATDAMDSGTSPPATLRSMSWSPVDQDRPDRRRPETDQGRSPSRDQNGGAPGPGQGRGVTTPGFRAARAQVDQARDVARKLAATGKPVTRRALRCGGVMGSNEALNALARMINIEMTGTVPSRVPAG